MSSGNIPTELGTQRIGALLRKYAIPGIIAMTASSLYNLVDSIFIGRMPGTGSLALSGLAISFPLMNISAALGTLVGVGAATMVSVLLGQKRYATASRVLANEVALNILIGLLYAESAKQFSGEIESRAVYWAAVDKFVKAKNMDPSVAGRANSYISSYSQYFPSMETIFFNDYNEGQSFNVGGWIGETTTIRAKK